MDLISKIFLLAGVMINPVLYAQNPVQKTSLPSNYTAPTDIPIFLSGNYGEVRSAHFHTGIDIKTEQVEGKNVLAANKGYIYRIVVQAGGYGKALYLKHANGQVTVYAHLRQFIPAVENYVREEQYSRRSFEVDLYPPSDRFAFNKGELIGLSGNTGNSAGPHLHFEIRNRFSIPLNALKYGFDIVDKTSPRIKWLAVYPLSQQSTVNGSDKKLLIPVARKNRNHYITPDTIRVSGSIGFGIETYDFLDNSPNECSPYAISLKLDEKKLFSCYIDSIPFSQGSYVNSYIDYEEKMKSGRNIQKLFLDPNNKLGIYKVAVNRGILQLHDTLQHSVRVTVGDTYGNESALLFSIKSTDRLFPTENELLNPNFQAIFRYDALNVFEHENIRVVVPRDALFDNVEFQYAEIKNDSCKWSLIHQVHNEYTPLFKSYILSIRPLGLPAYLQGKALIASQAQHGEWVSKGGEYQNGFVTTKVNTFGRFFIAVDTLDPVIIPVSFKAENRYAKGQPLTFQIKDTQSGIRKYNGYIDKKWALFEYDAKNDLLTYTIDENRLQKDRSHLLEIIVTDNKDNVAKFRGEFFY